MSMHGRATKKLTAQPTHTITRPALCATPSQYAVAGAMLLLNHIVPWVAGFFAATPAHWNPHQCFNGSYPSCCTLRG